jgi:hypothetical protein
MEPRWVWTCSGRCFGYCEGDDLWTLAGRHVGRRDGPDVFGATGRYLGELMSNGRLITNKAKAGITGITFKPAALREAVAAPVDGAALIIYRGYQDFPEHDEL